MAKIKLTKNELKQQRDALKRFERYLPTLQLKQQQLQLEARRIRARAVALAKETSEHDEALAGWIGLLCESDPAALAELTAVESWTVGTHNIAGIDTPVFEGISFRDAVPDLFLTPPWFDEALAALRRRIELELRRRILNRQLELVETELRIVTQRVNLFEKVKIPEARENIRRIQIYLGDQQTNAVGSAKIAKGKSQARDLAQAAQHGVHSPA